MTRYTEGFVYGESKCSQSNKCSIDLQGLIVEAKPLHSKILSDFQPGTSEFAIRMKACESTLETLGFGSNPEALSSFKAIRLIPASLQEYDNQNEKTESHLNLVRVRSELRRFDARWPYRYSCPI